MRLAEPIETTGVFWLPRRPDAQLPGTLRISESGEVTVALTGIIDNPLVTPRKVMPDKGGGARDSERIVGTVRDGGSVTLDRCLWQTTSLSFSSGLSASTIYAEIAFLGAEYEEEEEPLFKEFSFAIEGLDTWLSISGIQHEQDLPERSGLLRYHVPDEITLRLPCGVELSFSFGMTFPSTSLHTTEATVRQNVAVWVRPERPRPVEYFSSLAFKLCNFITLALDQGVSVQSMTGYLDLETNSGRSRRMPVRIYAEFAPMPERKPTIRWHNALFRYPNVAGQFDAMLAKWLENYESFEPAFNLYFASRTESSQYLDTKILWLAQALETLHRKSSNDTAMEQTEFDRLRERVIQSCPQDRRQWLSERLRNELSLRQRMRILLEPFERWFGDERQRKSFVDRACDTRNYLTHYDEATTRKRAAGPDELYELYQQLEALFQLHLLSLIGLDAPTIDSIVRNNRGLRETLGAEAS